MTSATAAPQVHPAAWIFALALHGAALSLLMPRLQGPPAGTAFTIGLSGFGVPGQAPSGGAAGQPDDAAPASEAAPPFPPGEALTTTVDAPAAIIPPPPGAALPTPPAVTLAPVPRGAIPHSAPVPPAAAQVEAPPLAAAPAPELAQVLVPAPAADPPPLSITPPLPTPFPPEARRQRDAAAAPRPARPVTDPTPRGSGRATPSHAGAASAGASGGEAATTPGGSSAMPSGRADAPTEGLPPSYAAQVRRILERNMRYPARAREEGVEGTAMVRFVIQRDGTVAAAQLIRSSGSTHLDHEAMALLRRVSPLPQLPPEIVSGSAAVVVPIAFALN